MGRGLEPASGAGPAPTWADDTVFAPARLGTGEPRLRARGANDAEGTGRTSPLAYSQARWPQGGSGRGLSPCSELGCLLDVCSGAPTRLERASRPGFNLLTPNRLDGAQGRNRTTDTAIFSRVLYQLSYLGSREPFGSEAGILAGGASKVKVGTPTLGCRAVDLWSRGP